MTYTYTLSPEYATRGYIAGYLIGAVLLWIAFVYWREWKDSGWGFPLGGVFLTLTSVLIFGAAWLGQDSFTENPNTKIVGTLVDNYEATVREKTGKHTYSDVPYSFVIYALPDGGQVSFRRNTGHVYPKHVYMYRNPK